MGEIAYGEARALRANSKSHREEQAALSRAVGAEKQAAAGVHRLWRPNHWLFALAVLAVPAVFRTLLIWENEIRIRACDVQGFYADLCVSTLFVLVAVLTGAVTRLGLYALAIVWCVLHYANYENVRALGAMLQVENAFHLGDATFLEGSALAISRPYLLVALLAVTLAAAWWALKFRRLDRQVWQVFAAALVVVAGAGLCKSRDAAHWRESHFAVDNLRAMVRLHRAKATSLDAQYQEPAELASRLDALYRADLAGSPRVALGRGRQNVLLVVLEGISGAHIEAIRKRAGVACNVRMPNLSRLCEENLTWTQFVAHNRQTNRGLWAILSGTYDGMTVDSTARMTDYGGPDERRLLPHVLRDNGYQTVFLEAAPLTFMQKDQFMPRAGFERVMGDEIFAGDPQVRMRTKWGPDDRSFFERATETVEELQEKGTPWFLTLLTTGTHHPYEVPKEFDGPGEKNTFARAAAYADLAVGEFVERLKMSGALESTLVLITSDESAGLQKWDDELLVNLSQNWGFLTAIVPQGQRGEVDEMFTQSDLSLSILDYLGLAEQAPHFGGRSVFRQYESRRPVFIANHYFRQIGLFDVDNTLTLCCDDWAGGQRQQMKSERLFGAGHVSRGYDLAASEIVRAMAHRTDASSLAAVRRKYELAAEKEYVFPDASGRLLLFGGQYISLKPQTVVKVDLDLEIVADGRALVDLDHELLPLRPFADKKGEGEGIVPPHALQSDSIKSYVSRRVSCFAGGGRFRLSYCYDNVSENRALFCNLAATKRTRGACTVKVHRATLETIPRSMWTGPKLLEDAAQVGMEKYDGASWENLAALCEGSSLDLAGANLNERWLEQLGKLRQVEALKLDGSNVTDEGLRYLLPLAKLQWLSLDGTKVTDHGLLKLQSLGSLREVSVRNTAVSQQAIQRVTRSSPNSSPQQF